MAHGDASRGAWVDVGESGSVAGARAPRAPYPGALAGRARAVGAARARRLLVALVGLVAGCGGGGAPVDAGAFDPGVCLEEGARAVCACDALVVGERRCWGGAWSRCICGGGSDGSP